MAFRPHSSLPSSRSLEAPGRALCAPHVEATLGVPAPAFLRAPKSKGALVLNTSKRHLSSLHLCIYQCSYSHCQPPISPASAGRRARAPYFQTAAATEMWAKAATARAKRGWRSIHLIARLPGLSLRMKAPPLPRSLFRRSTRSASRCGWPANPTANDTRTG